MPDIIILTGGVSVGKCDYVKKELDDFGVKELFWKVSQKPGKPFHAGIKNNTLFFGDYPVIQLLLSLTGSSAFIKFYLSRSDP